MSSPSNYRMWVMANPNAYRNGKKGRVRKFLGFFSEKNLTSGPDEGCD